MEKGREKKINMLFLGFPSNDYNDAEMGWNKDITIIVCNSKINIPINYQASKILLLKNSAKKQKKNRKNNRWYCHSYLQVQQQRIIPIWLA